MIVLVTGANKGIGREIAAQLAELGHTVVVGARSAEAGQKTASELGGDVSAVVLDVTDQGSVDAAAAEIERRHGRLDALVNNAGISRPPGGGLGTQGARTADVDAIRTIFETNVFGLIRVTTAMLGLLDRSDAPRIVNVSSSAGSLTKVAALSPEDTNPPVALGYSPSKTADTALTLQYARALAPDGILVNAVCPGYVATDLNNHAGHRTPQQGAAQAVRMVTIPADGPTGTFTDDEGTVPW